MGAILTAIFAAIGGLADITPKIVKAVRSLTVRRRVEPSIRRKHFWTLDMKCAYCGATFTDATAADWCPAFEPRK